MGGRGSTSAISGTPVTKGGARLFYNASKKSDALRGSGTVKKDVKLERSAQSGKIDFIDSVKDKKEAKRISEYYRDRLNETRRKIAKLGSADALYKNQRLAKEYRNLLTASNKAQDKMHEFNQKIEKGDTSAMHDASRTTTTYDRARKRRMKNFDAWFNAGR
jgi:hypothetical protein